MSSHVQRRAPLGPWPIPDERLWLRALCISPDGEVLGVGLTPTEAQRDALGRLIESYSPAETDQSLTERAEQALGGGTYALLLFPDSTAGRTLVDTLVGAPVEDGP